MAVLVCSRARSGAADVSDVTVHCAGAPLPVRANSKSVGAAPGVILSMAIMMAPVSARPADAAHAKAHARAVAARMRLIDPKLRRFIPSMGDLLGRGRCLNVSTCDGE